MSQQPRDNLEQAHRPERIRARLEHGARGGHLGDVVLGAIDGGITSFAIVAGAVGGGFSSLVIIVMGFASLLADGFSMAVSNYLGSKSDAEAAEQAHREERRHIREVPEGQCEELRQIFAAKGFEGETLERILEVVSRDAELWAETVVQEEFGLHAADAGRPVRAGAATFGGFLVAGVVPLVPFLFPMIELDLAFVLSIVATSAAFLAIGLAKGYALDQPPLRAGLETLAIGGGAALLAYAVGRLLQLWLDNGAIAQALGMEGLFA
jgi:vacuolar iron transporter family protein